MVYLYEILHTYTFKHCPATGMLNDDEAPPIIISAVRGLLVKMLITLERVGIFKSKFAYIYILKLSRHWYAKR